MHVFLRVRDTWKNTEVFYVNLDDVAIARHQEIGGKLELSLRSHPDHFRFEITDKNDLRHALDWLRGYSDLR